MDNQHPLNVSVIEPVGPAIEHVKLMLFKPFDISKWFIIGFCAWLAQLGQGGSGGNPGGGGDGHQNLGSSFDAVKNSILANLAIITIIAAIVIPLIIIIALVLCWLRSRGQFMFVHCIAGNKAEVVIPWHKYARHGNSLFLFRIVLGLIAFVSFGIPIAIGIFTGIMLGTTGFNIAALSGLIAAIFVFIGLVIFFGLVSKFTTDFVVPIMFVNTESSVAGWKICLSLIRGNIGRMILYILFQVVIWFAIAFISFSICLVACCFCCCLVVLFMLPYIGTVILLPLFAFKRAYSLFYLRQYGTQFDVFSMQP